MVLHTTDLRFNYNKLPMVVREKNPSRLILVASGTLFRDNKDGL
jgi:hypothetical protein